MTDITLNPDQRLYVIPSGGGYSCLGFDVAFQRACAYADAIAAKRPDLAEQALEQKPDPEDWGTLAVYNAHQTLVSMIVREKIDIGTFYEPGTHPEVRRQLELARNGGYRLKLEHGDGETGQAWSDRAEAGTISRSMGPIKVPLLIKKAGSHGGGAVMSSNIVKISAMPGGTVLWQHPGYQPGHHVAAAPAA